MLCMFYLSYISQGLALHTLLISPFSQAITHTHIYIYHTHSLSTYVFVLVYITFSQFRLWSTRVALPHPTMLNGPLYNQWTIHRINQEYKNQTYINQTNHILESPHNTHTNIPHCDAYNIHTYFSYYIYI